MVAFLESEPHPSRANIIAALDANLIWETLRQAPGTDITKVSHGAVDAALAGAARKITAIYRTPFQMHGSIGRSCAIADVRSDRAVPWSATQMPHEARRVMAQLLGIAVERVELRWFEGAGGYGRNGFDHVNADAALMSQAVGRPVRVQSMRW
ncbi:MAG: molybdopterin cofactor-binding domain-containing protein, partial [Bradyrhizobium sp.]